MLDFLVLQQLLVFAGEYYAQCSAVRPSLSPCVVEGGQLSHHPLGEEGWARKGHGKHSGEDALHLMKLIYL